MDVHGFMFVHNVLVIYFVLPWYSVRTHIYIYIRIYILYVYIYILYCILYYKLYIIYTFLNYMLYIIYNIFFILYMYDM